MEQENKNNKSYWPWVKYGAVFISIFFALALLTGRISMQSYWNEYGLSLDMINMSFINYAIASPNTTIASIMIAVIMVAVIGYPRDPIVTFLKNFNLIIKLCLGSVAIISGVVTLTIIFIIDLTQWPNGLAGLTLSTGFFIAIIGVIMISEAFSNINIKPKLEKKPLHEAHKWLIVITVIQWWRSIVDDLKKKLFNVLVVISLISIVYITSWGILDSAKKFGITDAHTDYKLKPVAAIQLDSSNGLEDLSYTITTYGIIIENVKIITESSDFLYFSTNNILPAKIHVIPISRVQAIQYTSNITTITN